MTEQEAIKAGYKYIEGYEGHYMIDTHGNVFSLKRQKTMIPCKSSNGYMQVHLTKDVITKSHKIHRLVAQAFIPNPNNLPQVNHIDGNKKNNFVENLEWCTQIENWEHSLKTGLREKCEPVKIKVFSKEGKFLYEFPSIEEASRKMSINSGNISRCCNGNCKSAGGYIFRKVV